jgi:hypothetical protein
MRFHYFWGHCDRLLKWRSPCKYDSPLNNHGLIGNPTFLPSAWPPTVDAKFGYEHVLKPEQTGLACIVKCGKWVDRNFHFKFNLSFPLLYQAFFKGLKILTDLYKGLINAYFLWVLWASMIVIAPIPLKPLSPSQLQGQFICFERLL